MQVGRAGGAGQGGGSGAFGLKTSSPRCPRPPAGPARGQEPRRPGAPGGRGRLGEGVASAAGAGPSHIAGRGPRGGGGARAGFESPAAAADRESASAAAPARGSPAPSRCGARYSALRSGPCARCAPQVRPPRPGAGCDSRGVGPGFSETRSEARALPSRTCLCRALAGSQRGLGPSASPREAGSVPRGRAGEWGGTGQGRADPCVLAGPSLHSARVVRGFPWRRGLPRPGLSSQQSVACPRVSLTPGDRGGLNVLCHGRAGLWGRDSAGR